MHLDTLRNILRAKGVEDKDEFVSLFNASFIFTDPALPDNPIVWASKGFTDLSGYEQSDFIGKNCRFLQGPETRKQDVLAIRKLVQTEQTGVVKLLNYTKDGRTFNNVFMLVPLKVDGKTVLFLGAQSSQIFLMSPSGKLSNKVLPNISNVLIESGGTADLANGQPVPLLSDYVSGAALLKTKTAFLRADLVPCFDQTPDLFDLQIQFRLTRAVPELQELYMGVEIKGRLRSKMGFSLSVLALAFLSSFNIPENEVHFSVGSDVEYAHIVLPFRYVPDVFVVTDSGSVPPALTYGRLPSIRQDYKGLAEGKTYTLSSCSSVIDFEEWALTNLPGVINIDMKKIWSGSDQKLSLISYFVPKGSKKHLWKERSVLFEVLIAHKELEKGLRGM